MSLVAPRHVGYAQSRKGTMSPALAGGFLTTRPSRNHCTLLTTLYIYSNIVNWLFSSVQSLSHVWLFVTPGTPACQASLSVTNSRSSLKPMSIESVMPFKHVILCCPLLLLPSIFPSTRVFSNESALCIRWPEYWSFSFKISPSREHPGLISIRMDWYYSIQ